MQNVMKSGSLKLLEASRPVQACNGIALPLSNEKRRISHIVWHLLPNMFNPLALELDIYSLAHHLCKDKSKAVPL